MAITDLIWTVAGFLLTIMVLSYIFGDNPLFRIALYIFIGVSAGYVAVVIIYQILMPKLIIPLLYGKELQRLLALIPLILSTLLLFKLSPRFARIGNLSVAYLVGAGAAVLIGGTIFGTLFPQISGTVQAFRINQQSGLSPVEQLIGASVILIGAATSLAYFHFGASQRPGKALRRMRFVEILAAIGKFFIAFTLGAIFSGVFLSALAALVERLGYLWNFRLLFFR
jgi:hypothetical protein